MCIQLGKTLYDGESSFQKIAIYETPHYGRMMTIDGCIQSTERDEFSYHEMMAHVPLFSHPSPATVCIIGGGDGGVLREILRHECIEMGILKSDDFDALAISIVFDSAFIVSRPGPTSVCTLHSLLAFPGRIQDVNRVLVYGVTKRRETEDPADCKCAMQRSLAASAIPKPD